MVQSCFWLLFCSQIIVALAGLGASDSRLREFEEVADHLAIEMSLHIHVYLYFHCSDIIVLHTHTHHSLCTPIPHPNMYKHLLLCVHV